MVTSVTNSNVNANAIISFSVTSDIVVIITINVVIINCCNFDKFKNIKYYY